MRRQAPHHGQEQGRRAKRRHGVSPSSLQPTRPCDLAGTRTSPINATCPDAANTRHADGREGEAIWRGSRFLGVSICREKPQAEIKTKFYQPDETQKSGRGCPGARGWLASSRHTARHFIGRHREEHVTRATPGLGPDSGPEPAGCPLPSWSPAAMSESHPPLSLSTRGPSRGQKAGRPRRPDTGRRPGQASSGLENRNRDSAPLLSRNQV